MTDQPQTFIAKSAMKFVRAKVEPTERSMPPTIITRPRPNTIRPISPACRLMLTKAPIVRKF